MRLTDGVRAFGYLRLSREREASTSIAKQRESIQHFCAEREWNLIECFEDVDVSGTKESRPALNAMLARLDECDVIVFHRLDRVMRTVLGFAKLLERTRAADVNLVSTTEPFDTSTAIGRAFVWLLASVAEIEAENTSKRIKATHEHLLRSGRPVGRARSFGWTQAGKDFVQVVDEVAVVRVMIEAFLSGRGLTQIADALNDGTLMGVPIPSTYDGRWTGGAVDRVLSSYRLIGHLKRHGTTATAEPILAPVVDVETFRTLQAELSRRRRTQIRVRVGQGELTGIIHCSVCGHRMYLAPNGPRATSYMCNKQRGHSVSISAPFIQEEMAKRLFEHLDPMRDGLAEAERALDEEEGERSEFEAAVDRLMWGREELDRQYFQERRLEREQYEVQLAEINERIERLRDKLGADDRDRILLRSRMDGLGDIAEVWPAMEVEERRSMFALWVRRIEISPRIERLGNRNDARRLVLVDWRA